MLLKSQRWSKLIYREFGAHRSLIAPEAFQELSYFLVPHSWKETAECTVKCCQQKSWTVSQKRLRQAFYLIGVYLNIFLQSLGFTSVRVSAAYCSWWGSAIEPRVSPMQLHLPGRTSSEASCRALQTQHPGSQSTVELVAFQSLMNILWIEYCSLAAAWLKVSNEGAKKNKKRILQKNADPAWKIKHLTGYFQTFGGHRLYWIIFLLCLTSVESTCVERGLN